MCPLELLCPVGLACRNGEETEKPIGILAKIVMFFHLVGRRPDAKTSHFKIPEGATIGHKRPALKCFK